MSEPLSPEYIRILQGMSGEEKLRTAAKMWWTAGNLKTAFLREQHPDWTEEQVEEQVKKIMLHAAD